MKYVFIDSEFNKVTESRVNPVCIAFGEEGSIVPYWNHKQDHDNMAQLLQSLHNSGAIFVSFSAESEARYFHALGLDPTKFKWICLYLEWRQLLNHNDSLYCGDHLDGRVTPFRGAPSYSLAGALFRLLKIKIDTDHKIKMRDLIISQPHEFSPKELKSIMDYCVSDTTHLPKLFKAMLAEYTKLFPKKYVQGGDLLKHMLLRGEYAARTAIMVGLGYPINVEATKNFSDNTGIMLSECMSDINAQFPEITPFRWEKKRAVFVMNTKPIRAWIAQQDFAKQWDLTEGGASGLKKELSLSVETWTKFFDYKHNYPRGNFGAQMVRYFKLKQSLNGFMPRKEGDTKKKNFWDSVGTDGRVRPYFGIYGAQSGRSQPSATGFIPLKAAWMRSLIQARPGRAIASIDYSSQEFLLSALVASDSKMLKAYESGDVYLAFAKQIGIAPKDATKASHKFERDLCKSTILGLSYLMSKVGLSRKLTNDTGKYHSEEDAQKLIDLFDEAYPILKSYREELYSEYEDSGYLQIPCGWSMFGNNPNFRSVSNMPIQGFGSSILRKSVALAQDSGVEIIYTLHDAIYIEYDSHDFAAIDKLAKAMDEGFRYYFPESIKHKATCRLEAETWSLDYDKGEVLTPGGLKVPTEKIHVDERAVDEYNKFSKYFTISRATENDYL